jgi:hypothetical protein
MGASPAVRAHLLLMPHRIAQVPALTTAFAHSKCAGTMAAAASTFTITYHCSLYVVARLNNR